MNKIIFIVGPTASGKTDISIAVAKRVQGEIISADSMQVYRGLDIGTAKITAEQKAAVPHHLIDVIEPSEEFSIHEFRKQALDAISAIHARQHIPIVVGGSGLYVKALMDGLSPHPGEDVLLRQSLRERAANEGLASLYGELFRCDPVTAARIKPQDARRIIRALEVYRLSGTPLSAWEQETKSLAENGYMVQYFGIVRDRAELYARVHERVDAMLAHGLLDEAKHLWGQALSKTTRQAVGYKELFMYYAGECSSGEAIALIKKNTRHLVKKQFTWFRKDKRIEWIDVTGLTDYAPVVTALSNRITEKEAI